MCLEEREPIDHLFVHYKLVSSFWILALSFIGVNWTQPSNVKDMLVA